jgi:hypothetical protein
LCRRWFWSDSLGRRWFRSDNRRRRWLRCQNRGRRNDRNLFLLDARPNFDFAFLEQLDESCHAGIA